MLGKNYLKLPLLDLPCLVTVSNLGRFGNKMMLYSGLMMLKRSQTKCKVFVPQVNNEYNQTNFFEILYSQISILQYRWSAANAT